ncbi:MAG TPA: Gfo/Idh/MocA family oxidoreductase, partial [Rhodothermales bacterium]
LLASGNYAWAAATDTIRIGLVGAGGRGTGAARDAFQSSPGVELVAVAELFPDRMESGREKLREAFGDAYKVDRDHEFVGFDAYRHVIDSDVNYVILATPPVFRPQHLAYAIEKGRHVFMEKPVAIDPEGVRAVMAAADAAKQKGLAIVAGTQRRHDPKYVEAMRRIHDGAIGEVMAAQVYWNQGALWHVERTPGMTDVEWQLRNWLYFTYLSGDHIVEQHVHNIDVANWALQAHPIKAVAVGGRQTRVSPDFGHIFDHFAVDFEYPNGARVISMCRQQEGTSAYVGEHIMGTTGTSNGFSWIRGANAWRWEGEEVNPYVQEHADNIAAIRAGKPLNEGHQIAESVLTAIMGREAAYTGLDVTWDQILNSSQNLTPATWEFGMMPVPPVPVPGVTKIDRTLLAHAG